MNTLLTLVLATVINIVPCPQSVEQTKGSFKLKSVALQCDQTVDAKTKSAVADFAAQLTIVSGHTHPFLCPVGLTNTVANGNAKGFCFVNDSSFESEAYSIEVTKKSVVVRASDFNGFFYAIQSLKQMLPVSVYGKKADTKSKWALPCCVIKDKPRFSYRGLHLDCCRHFFSIDEVKKIIDEMATLKLNRLHWHITEDQGWRAEIKAYPLLTEIGGYRESTIVGYQPAGGPQVQDGIRHGGYYTQDQMREVVAYADARGIVVIPEVDLPGHMLAALAAYPEYGCTGGPYKVATTWGVFPEVLCPGKEKTFEFLETILGELCDIFPGEYFHIGGDECPKSSWEVCPDCQARIAELGLKDDDHATKETRLQNYVTSRLQSYLATRGKKIIGWDEILEGDLEEGATVMSWRGTEGGIEASKRGFDVIMTPHHHLYFDYCQSDKRTNLNIPIWEDVDEPLCAWWGVLPIEKVYSFDPTEGLDAQAASHVLGAQANVWTEYIPTTEQLEYQIFPRIFALCEVQWCEYDTRDFDRLSSWIKTTGFPMLDIKGVNYRNK